MITWEGGEEPIRLMLKEGMRHKWRLVLGFVLICTAGVALGLFWPKTYASSVTVSLEQENIIDTLMQGRAVRTGVEGPPENAEQMQLGRSLLERALVESGAIDDSTPARERDRLITGLGDRTGITQPGENLVTIHYRGPGPEAAQRMTDRLGQLFMDETRKGQARESAAAFKFIDRQVQSYEQKLAALEQRIESLRAEHPVAEPGAAQQLTQQETALKQQVSDLQQQIEEARIRDRSLQDRLAQAPAAGGDGEGGAPGAGQLAQLRGQLANLRLRYTDSHPDVLQLERQIAQLEQHSGSQSGSGPDGQASQDGAAGSADSALAAVGGSSPAPVTAGGAADDASGGEQGGALAAIGTPLYQQLQGDLYNNRTQIQTLQSRLESVRSQLASVREDQQALESVQGQLNQLQRDYQVNQNIYEDLLSRRENARVSRDLGSTETGLAMHIQEPAQAPTQAELPRPLHFALAGGVLGAGLPIGLLFLVVMLDPRIRDVAHVPVESSSVLLTTIPHARSRVERRVAPLSVVACVLVVIATVVSLAALMWMQTSYGI